MPAQPRPTIVTGSQMARILGLSRSRMTQLRHGEGCPYIDTPAGDRFDVQEVLGWYMSRQNGSREPAHSATTPAHDHAEALRRMVAVVHRAIQEHVEALTSDRGLTRFLAILEALGLDDRTRYLAGRSIQLWLGTTLPGGEAAVVMEDPGDAEPAAWEIEWRAVVAKMIAGHPVEAGP